MPNPRKKILFQTEVAIAILALVLVMVIMNFAANRSLSRVTYDLREAHRDGLTRTALKISGELEVYSDSAGLASALKRIVTEEDIDYVFVMDSSLNELAQAPDQLPQVIRDRIRAITLSEGENGSFASNKYQFTYRRDSESKWEIFHYPITQDGKWLIVTLAKRTDALASIESDMRYLLISGVIVVTLLSLGVFAFFRGVTSPIRNITKSVAAVGASADDAESAVDELVGKYKETIATLENKERRLLELNERLEGQLGDVERFNNSLLGAITTGVVVIDSKGALIGINDKARTYLGSDETILQSADKAEDYVGLFAEYPEIKSRVEQVLLSANCDTPDFEYERTAADGAINTFRVSLMPLLENKSSLRELMLLISDQTEVARAQKRLEDSRQLATLGEMSAGLAHQLRNSISAAMGFSALVKRKTEDADLEGSAESLESLLKELHDEAALVDRFLSFSKPLSLDAEMTQISEFLAGALAGYSSDPETDARVHVEIKSDGQVELDALLLKQALGNLIDNGLRASQKNNSPVDIVAEVSSDEVSIIVSDYGCGISADEQERIFTPFYSSSPSGTGLGLSLARKIVALHGGVLDLVSRPNCGSTFTIQFPRYQNQGFNQGKDCLDSAIVS